MLGPCARAGGSKVTRAGIALACEAAVPAIATSAAATVFFDIDFMGSGPFVESREQLARSRSVMTAAPDLRNNRQPDAPGFYESFTCGVARTGSAHLYDRAAPTKP